MKFMLACGVVALFGPAWGPVLAQGDAEAGRLKADTCMGCHGIPGYTQAYPTYAVPKLGGQHAAYIVAALQAYKSGERVHKTMHAQAATLSTQDMEDIAAYFEAMGSQGAGAEPAAGAAGAKQDAKPQKRADQKRGSTANKGQ
jgi:cytochrome c553